MDKFTSRLNTLIETGYHLRNQMRNFSSKPYTEREQAAQSKVRWLQSCYNFFDYVPMPIFADKFRQISKSLEESYLDNPSFTVAELIGVLESARDEISTGFAFKIKYLLHAEFYDSIIDQAENLFKFGHIIPAAVLGRIIIEQWLKDEAEKNNINIEDTDKASVINDRLKTAKIFSTPKWRQIQSLIDVGNAAAHGKSDEIEDSSIKLMFEFIRSNCF